MNTQRPTTVAMLLSCDSFESFFGAVLHLDRDKYLENYRNDWSWYYAKGLIENGVRPILYIPSLLYSGLYHTDAGVSVRFLPLASWYRPIFKIRRAMRATRWTLYLHERLNAAAFISSLHQAIETDQVHILYLQEYWNARFDFLAGRVSVPFFAADHGGLRKGVVRWFKRRAFSQTALLYCQSEEECAHVREYGGNATWQPNGGDTTFFVPPPIGTERKKNIVTVARLTDKQKRTSDLIRAMKLLPEPWTLDIVGTGPDLHVLQSLVGSLGLTARVTFHGFQGRQEIKTFLQTCGVYSMPSANEAMCIAVLEAMACGAPVVASRIRTFESLITDKVNGILFPVGDVPALASSIELAWSARQTLGPAAVKTVTDHFNATILYRQLAHSLQSAAGRPAFEPAKKLAAAGGA